jgi:hypothetical protein
MGVCIYIDTHITGVERRKDIIGNVYTTTTQHQLLQEVRQRPPRAEREKKEPGCRVKENKNSK